MLYKIDDFSYNCEQEHIKRVLRFSNINTLQHLKKNSNSLPENPFEWFECEFIYENSAYSKVRIHTNNRDVVEKPMLVAYIRNYDQEFIKCAMFINSYNEWIDGL